MGDFFKGHGVTMKDTCVTGVPCTMYGDIYVKYGIIFEQVDYFLPAEKAEKAFKGQYGDLLFTASGETAEEIGKCAGYFGNNEICIGGDIIVLRPYECYDSLFLSYLCNSPECIRQKAAMGQGDAVVHIKTDNIQNISLSLPESKEKQKRIASALSSIDIQIATIKKLLSKYESIKKATVKLLMMPGDNWKQYRIGDVCPLQRGFDLPHSEQIPGDYPVICSNGISGYNKTYMVKGPGVVTGRSGTIGKVHYIDGNFWPHNTTLWVTKFVNVIPRYAFFLLKEMDLAQFSGGTGVPTLNRNDIHDAIVSLPSISIQKEIVTKLVAIDSNLKEHMQELSKIQQIKQSMLRYFFG